MAAALADQLALGFAGALDSFPIRDLRLADIRVNFELAQHPIDDNLKVQLAHPGDQRLRSFLVDADAERGILFGHLLDPLAHLFLVRLGCSTVSTTLPATGGRSSGEGRKSTTASSIGCTPLLRNAEPSRTGVIAIFKVAARIAARIFSASGCLPSR